MRSAQRLRSEGGSGFCAAEHRGSTGALLLGEDFEGFEMAELKRTLSTLPNAVMICSCYTPSAVRGQGFFAAALAALGDQLRAAGKSPWIFWRHSRRMSLRGIEKAGFYGCTLGRRRIFFFEKVQDSIRFPIYSGPRVRPLLYV